MTNKYIPTIISEIEFNYSQDKREFKEKDRKVTISHHMGDDGVSRINLSFELGRKEEDDISLIFETEEFMQKLARAIAFGDL